MNEKPGLTGATPLSEGDVVSGRFRVINELGRGGYAIVYRAQDMVTDSIVALKTLRPLAPRPAEVVARFKREVALVSQLRHPNTVRVFDYGVEGDLFLAMELLDGHTLADELDGRTGLPLPRALRIVQAVLASLTEAHQLGIVHRDLKPENVFLMRNARGEEHVKVLDFGIAKLTRFEQRRQNMPSLTMAGRAMGTPTYMSPEQARGLDLTASSDLYAVGVLLYELIAGVAPFRGEHAMEIMLKHVNEPAPSLTVARLANTPIDRAIRKVLAKEQEDRFRDAHEFLAALGGTAAFIPGTVPEIGPVPSPNSRTEPVLMGIPAHRLRRPKEDTN